MLSQLPLGTCGREKMLNMSIVLIAGGTGLIGKHLSALLKQEGFEVRHLSRRANLNAPFPAYAWDPEAGTIDPSALEGISYVINLAGAGIADQPWTKKRKNTIISSRVNGTRTIKNALAASSEKPLAYVAASAIGFYGNCGEHWLDEHSPSGTGFLSESCLEWETATNEVAMTGIRTVTLRIGIVLSNIGGALPKLALPVKFHLAPNLGGGLQWYSWIHIEDVCRLFIFALRQNQMEGIFNAVAPTPVRLTGLMKTLINTLRVKAISLPVPALFLRLGMGEMAAVVLDSTRVSTRRALATGFQYKFPEIGPALKDLFGHKGDFF